MCFFVCVCVRADDLGELLQGECKLQTYLKENPIKQGSSPRGPRPKLVEVRKHLTAALDRGNLKVTVGGEMVDQPVSSCLLGPFLSCITDFFPTIHRSLFFTEHIVQTLNIFWN